MTQLDKIATLLAILSITFVWAYLIGEWLNTIEPTKIKKHGRYAVSLLRRGLDDLAEILLNYPFRKKELKRAVDFLACT